MFGFVSKIRAHIKHERTMLEDNRADVDAVNLSLLASLFGAGIAAFGALIVVSVFRDNYVTAQYIPVVTVLVIGLIALKVLPSNVKPSVIFFVGFLAIDMWCAYSSGYLWPNELSVMILAVLFLFSVTLLESTVVVTFSQVVLLVVYLVIVSGGKNPDYFLTETVNCIVFLLLGSLIGASMRAIRLENFNLKRQAVAKDNTDFLTGLGSRRRLFEDMADIDGGMAPTYYGLMMVDVDDFKLYNDTYGHQRGDECLKAIGRVFSGVSESGSATFYRYGGEEFVGLLHARNAEDMRAACDEVADGVRSLAIPHSGGHGIVSLSIGLALRDAGPDQPLKSYEQLLHEADLALYRAKASGKDRTVVYQPGFEEDFARIDQSFR